MSTGFVFLVFSALLLIHSSIAAIPKNNAGTRARRSGWFALVAGSSLACLALLYQSGYWVMALDEGLIFRGVATWIVLSIFVLCILIGVAVLIRGQLLALGFFGKKWRVIITCSVILLVAAGMVPLLPMGQNVLDATVSIHFVDLWWPPLTLLLAAAFGGCLGEALRLAPPYRIVLLALTLLLTTTYALNRPGYLLQASARSWLISLFVVSTVSICGSALVFAHFCTTIEFKGKTRNTRWALIPTAVILSTVLILLWARSAKLLDGQLSWSSFQSSRACWLVPIVVLSLVVLVLRFRMAEWKPRYPERRRVHPGMLILSVMFLAVWMAALYPFEFAEPSTGFFALLLSATLLGTAADHFPSDYKGLVQIRDWISDRSLSLLKRFKRTPQAVGEGGGALPEAVNTRSMRARGERSSWSSIKTIISSVVFTVIGLIVLALLNEITHMGETIVEPFQYSRLDGVGLAQPQDEGKVIKDPHSELGISMSDRLVSSLGQLKSELMPEIMVVSGQKRGGVASAFTMASSGGGSGETGVSKGGDLQIGKIEIPIELLTAPIRIPVRALLGTTTLNGRVEESATGFTLYVHSSGGDIWTEHVYKKDNDCAEENQYFENGTDSSQKHAARKSTPPTVDAILGCLANRMAFRILAADKKLDLPLTASWPAFLQFRYGLKSSRDYEQSGRYTSLQDAEKHFQEAIRADHQFAMAHYRLGRTFLTDGQPGRALNEFRESINADQTFNAGALAVASTAYDFISYYPEEPAAGLPPASSGRYWDADETGHQELARAIWKKVLISAENPFSASNRFAALVGLCKSSVDESTTSFTAEKLADVNRLSLLAFYYCQAAPTFLDRNELSQRRDDLGNIFSIIAMATQVYRGNFRAGVYDPTTSWVCESLLIDESSINAGQFTRLMFSSGPYNRRALHVYDKALEFSADTSVIECNRAAAAMAANDRSGMDKLGNSAKAHVAAGDEVRSQIKRLIEQRNEDSTHLQQISNDLHAAGTVGFTAEVADASASTLEASVPELVKSDNEKISAYVALARSNYQQAIALDPVNPDALNNYAYLFWTQKLLLSFADQGEEKQTGEFAEKYARQALELCHDHKSQSCATEFNTLGEVLLGRHRMREATVALKEALKLMGPSSNQELTWDLALAYRCTGNSSRAQQLVRDIGLSEAAREVKPFSGFQFAHTENVCAGQSSAKKRNKNIKNIKTAMGLPDSAGSG